MYFTCHTSFTFFELSIDSSCFRIFMDHKKQNEKMMLFFIHHLQWMPRFHRKSWRFPILHQEARMLNSKLPRRVLEMKHQSRHNSATFLGVLQQDHAGHRRKQKQLIFCDIFIVWLWGCCWIQSIQCRSWKYCDPKGVSISWQTLNLIESIWLPSLLTACPSSSTWQASSFIFVCQQWQRWSSMIVCCFLCCRCIQAQQARLAVIFFRRSRVRRLHKKYPVNLLEGDGKIKPKPCSTQGHKEYMYLSSFIYLDPPRVSNFSPKRSVFGS